MLRSITETFDRWGTAEYFHAPPGVTNHRDVLYMPSNKAGEGLYDDSGKIIESTVDGQRFSRPFRSDSYASIVKPECCNHISNGEYLYIGTLINHYGHFLINTISRFWPLFAEKSYRNMRLLCHAQGNASMWTSHPALRTILGSIGLDLDQLVILTEPTSFQSVYVPDPALVEQTSIYAVLGEAGRMVGRPYWHATKQAGAPLYISKTRLKTGVGHFRGECAIEREARDRGFKIFYPELHSFTEQITTLSEHRVVAGTLGSAFHTSLFCAPKRRFFCLAPVKDINTNFILIDRVTGAQTTYMVPRKMNYDYGGDFLTTVLLDEPDLVAREFIDLVDEEFQRFC